LGRKEGIKYYRIRISDEEALALRQAISYYLSFCHAARHNKPHYKLLSQIYARLAHLKSGPPKGIRIYKKS